jgi:hypothetical protein
MIFWYTAGATYDRSCITGNLSWDKYIEWSRICQLQELVSLDCMLNELLVEPDRESAADWTQIIVDRGYETGFFTTADYVLDKVSQMDTFNFLTVVREPDTDCCEIILPDYDFLGYELLDKYYGNSALSNCGGFDETFLPSELNKFGLIDDYENANVTRERLYDNNPDEDHADCNVIAIWRHKTVGRKK